jgi:hypothetical protein
LTAISPDSLEFSLTLQNRKLLFVLPFNVCDFFEFVPNTIRGHQLPRESSVALVNQGNHHFLAAKLEAIRRYSRRNFPAAKASRVL